MTRLVLAAAVGLALLTACAEPLCDRVERIGTALETKSGPCRADGGVGYTSTFGRQKCETGTRACTAADQATLHRQLDCLDALPECGPGGARPYLDGMAACTASDAGTFSASCGTGGL